MWIFTRSIQEFVKGCGSVTKRWVDGLLDKMTADDHTKAVNQVRQVFDFTLLHTLFLPSIFIIHSRVRLCSTIICLIFL